MSETFKVDKRDITGIILLDKSRDLSSNRALQQIKRMFHAKKAGHTGSLDPFATGMLPICLGRATKFSQYLLHANKSYRVIAQLGIKTTTGDIEGEVVETHAVPRLTIHDIELVLQKFSGVISQLPPMFSALKFQGQPLYKLARKGVHIERKPRQITIFKQQLLQFDSNLSQIELEVFCSSGTYIRSLVEDIGEALGCGAHAIALRRLQVDPFYPQQMVCVSMLQNIAECGDLSSLDQFLLPVDVILKNSPLIILEPEQILCLRQGKIVTISDQSLTGLVRFYDNTQRFIGVGEIVDTKVISRQLI